MYIIYNIIRIHLVHLNLSIFNLTQIYFGYNEFINIAFGLSLSTICLNVCLYFRLRLWLYFLLRLWLYLMYQNFVTFKTSKFVLIFNLTQSYSSYNEFLEMLACYVCQKNVCQSLH